MMYGIIPIYSFNFRSSAAILVRHLGLQNLYFTVMCVKYIMYHIRPRTSENASKWIISDYWWANNWILSNLAALLDAILKIILFAWSDFGKLMICY